MSYKTASKEVKDMLVPLSWLKEYVDIDVEAKELEEKLAMIEEAERIMGEKI